MKRAIHMKLHPGLEWGIFHIITSEDIVDFTDIKFNLSLKSYLNSFVYDRNIFGSSSKVSRGNIRKLSENVRERSSGLLENPREIFGRWSEIFAKLSKRCHQYLYIIKRTLHVSSKI